MPRNFETTDNDQLGKELDAVSPKKKGPDYQPMYKVMGEAKIPVSKHHGKVWQGRLKNGQKARQSYEDVWREAIKYFNNDQMSHRTDRGPNQSGNTHFADRLNDEWTETENIIFANTTTLLPALYAKNPSVEFTSMDQSKSDLMVVYENLMNEIIRMKISPGVNLKPKVRKSILHALLSNCGWVKIGWTFKDASVQGAVQEITEIAEKLENAKSIKEVEELEGQLMAIEKHMEILEEPGPYALFCSPMKITIDPECEEHDLSDCRWLIEEFYLPTNYLNARYAKKNDSGQFVAVYDPTHILKSGKSQTGDNSVEDDVNNFSLFENDTAAKDYGYDTDESFNDAKRTKMYMCWERATRRIYLYAEKHWDSPVWVWEDMYNLLEFFPYYPLTFFENPEGWYAKGEVSYYLDQQDAINEINDEWRRARRWAKRNIMFNKNLTTKEDVEGFLNGGDGSAYGVDLPENTDIRSVVFSAPTPAMNFPELFDVTGKLQAIDRISSVSDVLRGVQFKTNTTNKAIDSYNSSSQMRLDEKIDKIEDYVGSIVWGLTQMCAQFLSPEDVLDIVGPGVMQQNEWRQMLPRELRKELKATVVGGSTAKPTSKAKKEEAIEVGQVLGQFADASPAVITVMLKVFEAAFDEVVLRDEDWDMIKESMQMNMNTAGAGPQGAGAANGATDPRVEQAVQLLVQQGIPEQQARQEIMSRMNGQPQGSA